MPIKKINNIHFNYELLGTEQGLAPIVFIAGYTCDINFWRPVAEALANSHQVLIFDHQGIGKTEDENLPLSVETMAVDIKALLDSFGLQKSILISFAFGSAIAQKIAHDYPRDISKIILVSAVLKFNASAKMLCEKLCALREEKKFTAYADVIYDSCFSAKYKTKIAKQAFINDFVPILGNSQTAIGQRRQVEALKNFDTTAWAKNSSVPAIIITPNEDQFSPPAEGKILAQTIAENGTAVKHVIMENCGHAVLMEQLDELIMVLKHSVN